MFLEAGIIKIKEKEGSAPLLSESFCYHFCAVIYCVQCSPNFSSCYLSFQLPVSHLPNKQLFLAAVLQLLDVQSGEPPVHIRPFSSVEELTALAQKRICFSHWLIRVHRSLSLHLCLWCLVVSGGGGGDHNCSGNVRLLNKKEGAFFSLWQI